MICTEEMTLEKNRFSVIYDQLLSSLIFLQEAVLIILMPHYLADRTLWDGVLRVLHKTHIPGSGTHPLSRDPDARVTKIVNPFNPSRNKQQI